MKRVTCIMVLLAVAAAAYAGPYFELENVGLALAPTLTIGVDGNAAIGQSPWVMSAGLAYFDEDLLAVASPWAISMDLAVGMSEALLLKPEGVVRYGVDFTLDSDLIFDPTNYPVYLGLDTWDTSLGVRGFYGALSVWVGASFPFALVNPPGPVGWTPTWGFIPRIGVGCHW
jgi:hypothetical protein